MKLMTGAIKFWFLPGNEKCLFIITFLTLFLIRIGLWVLPFRILRQIIEKIASLKLFTKREDRLMSEKIVRSVRRTSKFVPLATCLTQALTALLLIRLSGEKAELKFGVAIDLDQQFAAHAWLEREGKIILGKVSRHNKYTTLEPPKYAVL